MQLLRNLTVVLLGLLFASDAFAQRTPMMNQIPWWDYRPERITNDFQTIIDQNGTIYIEGTRNRFWTSSGIDLIPLSFDFYFMQERYDSGFRVGVAVDGFISFSGSTSTQTWGYTPMTRYWAANSTYRQHLFRMVAPYWSDLQTSGVSSPTGGVYYRTDGVAPNRVMTFEWRVRGGYYAVTSPGNFQAKLFENNSAIEFHYDENSIDRRVPSTGQFGYGALVGIRNFGQRLIARELTPQDFNNDEDNFVFMLHPDQIINGRQPGEDTLSFTRINTIHYAVQWGGGTPYRPVEYAYQEGYGKNPIVFYEASPYWHYSFPTLFGDLIAYELRPILNDMACDSVWFSPFDAINAYTSGTEVTVNARFQNRASNLKNDIPTRFDVYFGNEKIHVYTSEQQLASPGNRLGTDDVTFNPIPRSTNPVPATDESRNGVYEVRVYPQDPLEEDYKNDTCKLSYFILGQNDIIAFRILSPFENVPPLFTKYPVGVGVPVEARFLNVGLQEQNNVPVEYAIFRQGETTPIFESNSVLPGQFLSATFRDYVMPSWSANEPGTYCIRIWSNLEDDEDRGNDSIPVSREFCFTAAYEIELAASGTNNSPLRGQYYPIGRPIDVAVTSVNNGITDATNTPSTVRITDPAGNQVYDEMVEVQEIIADGGGFTQNFPNFVPSSTSGAGTYTVNATISNPQDPITANNTVTWTFQVSSPIRGDILVGSGERFETIKEARDSLFHLGVSGDVELILIDDEYTVAPDNQDLSNPAIDFRGTIVGAGESARITWKPHPNKQQVKIHLQSPSGIGMHFGQIGTDNPSGYMSFDGGPDRKLRVELQNTGTRDLYVPFYFGIGSSNYSVKNVQIAPYGGGDFHCTQRLSVPRYDMGFNQFSYVDDLAQQISAGIMLRNAMPFDPTAGTNALNADTLFCQNNAFENNHISRFGYGIVSIGAGPIMRARRSRFEEINNRQNTYRGNLIEDVSRAGIALVYEVNSDVVENRITGVSNDCRVPVTESKGASISATDEEHAAGIWVSAGGNSSANRGYSSDILIARNRISEIRTSSGNGSCIWVENNRNVLITPGGLVQEFPTRSAIDVRNNMAWDYSGSESATGIAITVATDHAGMDYVPGDNAVVNNTIYNRSSADLESSGVEYYGISMLNGEAFVQNNLVALMNSGAIGLRYDVRTPQYEPWNMSVNSDYNLLWVPNGAFGQLHRISPEGFRLPSPPVMENHSQWRYLTRSDENSVVGDILPEFMSLSPGEEDLHLNPQQVRSLAGNRGATLREFAQDIDSDPRSQAALNNRYDIGADEFWGAVNNNDLVAEDVISPSGWRATSGAFSDAEYVMSDASIDLTVGLRNIGGRPVSGVWVSLDIAYWNGVDWINEASLDRMASVDVAEKSEIDFGQYQPKTLSELGLSEREFVTMEPNVTPRYRFRVTTGNDENLANNEYQKYVRFYLQRSKSKSFVSVEHYMPGVDGSELPVERPEDLDVLGNKLNADSILSGFSQINWSRSGTVGAETDFTFDLFDRDRWPRYALHFAPWQLVVWMQGEESGGLLAEERLALKQQQESWNTWRRAGLFITGQAISGTHDVALDELNGESADRQFVQEYLRASHVRNTSPLLYEGLRVQGLRITHRRFEMVEGTGVIGDRGPSPSVVRATVGEGVAQGTHWYVDEVSPRPTSDSVGGITIATLSRAVVYSGIDIRHWGRFSPESDRSGVRRVVLGAIDFLDQYGGVLPIEVLSFEARQTGVESVTVRWETASEREIVGLEIERIEVLKREVGEILGATHVIASRVGEGGPEQGAMYSVVDERVGSGKEYEYRLISVERDGRRVVAARGRVLVRGGASSSYGLMVYPNPLSSVGRIEWRAPEGEAVGVRVLDDLGKVVLSEEFLSDGEGSLQLDGLEFSSGVYVVELRSGSEVLRQKVTVQK